MLEQAILDDPAEIAGAVVGGIEDELAGRKRVPHAHAPVAARARARDRRPHVESAEQLHRVGSQRDDACIDFFFR